MKMYSPVSRDRPWVWVPS